MTTPSTAPVVFRDIARLALPIALTHLGMTTMHMVDATILGHLSVNDFAAGGLGRLIGSTVAMVGIGVAAALDPVASQAVGANEMARAWAALFTNLRALALIFIPTALVSYGIASLLGSFGYDPAVADRVRLYILGQSPGYLLIFAYFALRNFLQAHHDTKRALLASVVANVANVPICALLVHGDGAFRKVGLPGLGLAPHGALGAGLAFTCCAAIEVAIVAPRAFRYRASDMRPDEKPIPIATMFRLGLPIGLQVLVEMAAFALCGLLAGRIGTNVAAAHLIAYSYSSVTFMPALGVAEATSVLVGRAVGRGESPRRVGYMGMGLGMLIMCFGAAAFLAIPDTLSSLLTTDPDVMALARRLLAVAACFQLFDGLQGVAAGALRGAGDVRFPFIAAVASYWGLAFPLAALFGLVLHGGATGLWWGMTTGIVVVAITHATRFWIVTSRGVARI